MFTFSNASLAAGVVCGTVVGYSVSSIPGNLLINTLLGVSRAAGSIIFIDPVRLRLLGGLNSNGDEQIAAEMRALMAKHTIVHGCYQANLGLGLGIALGSTLSAESLLAGGLTYAGGFFAEIIPVLAFSKPLHVEFDKT